MLAGDELALLLPEYARIDLAYQSITLHTLVNNAGNNPILIGTGAYFEVVLSVYWQYFTSGTVATRAFTFSLQDVESNILSNFGVSASQPAGQTFQYYSAVDVSADYTLSWAANISFVHTPFPLFVMYPNYALNLNIQNRQVGDQFTAPLSLITIRVPSGPTLDDGSSQSSVVTTPVLL